MGTVIVVTGAGGYVGRAVLERLWDSNAETVAIVRRAADLRATKILVDAMDSPRAFRAIHDADIVVHLAGTLSPRPTDTYYGANVATAAAVAHAARSSNVKRIVILSSLGADECSSNEYLRTKACAERLLRETKIPTVVLRSSHIVGNPHDPGPIAAALTSADNEPVKVIGTGTQVVAPIYRWDVAEAIIRAVDRGRAGFYELSGPDSWTMDDFVRLLNRNQDVTIRHIPQRLVMFLSRVFPGLQPAYVDLLVRSSSGNPKEAVKQLGLRFHSLVPIWTGNRSKSFGEKASPFNERSPELLA